MRLRQHERLRQRLRQAAADGDVLTIARLQQALAERTLEAVARAQATRVQRIDLKTAGAPPRCRTKRRFCSIACQSSVETTRRSRALVQI